jgi:ABC-type branched-subunit amino acid transport system ATPase component
MAPLLAVEDLHAAYGSGSVLAGVSLAIEAGEVVSLLGRNGMGKTTTVRAIMGLVRPSRAGPATRWPGPASVSCPRAVRCSPT